MANFRETLWFKRGLLDAAAPAQGTDKEHTSAPSADHLPIEDRYLDDGSVSARDSHELSLRTGSTTHLPRLDVAPREPGAHIGALVGELRRGRVKLIAMIAASTVAIGAMLVMFAS